MAEVAIADVSWACTWMARITPAAPATYTVSAESPLAVPVAADVRTASAGLPAWTWWLPRSNR